ncbi:MAG: DUF4097 family beta strand repeat-containing protein [Hyphomicrobiales bacterium]
MFARIRGATAVCLTALVAVTGCTQGAGAAEVRNVSERVFPLEPNGDVTIASQNGRISIEGWDRSEVRVQITRTVRADDEKRAQELLRGLMVDVETAPNSIKLTSRYPKRHEEVGIWAILVKKIESLNIHYYLQVPRDASLDLRTANGAIRVRGAGRSADVVTVNGDVEVAGTGGPVDARTTNGEIKLTGIAGSATARTTNGDVTVEILSLPGDGIVDLGTTNGNIEARLPKDIHADVEAVTTNGRVDLGFPVKAQGRLTSKTIRGTIGGGGAHVTLQTTNGSIDLSPGSGGRNR